MNAPVRSGRILTDFGQSREGSAHSIPEFVTGIARRVRDAHKLATQERASLPPRLRNRVA